MMHLLKKELSELITRQMVISLVVSLAVLLLLGYVMRNSMNSEEFSGDTIRIVDQDRTDFTGRVIDRLKDKGYEIVQGGDFEAMVESDGWKNAVEFPAGMTAALLERHEPAELVTHTALKTISAASLSFSGNTGSETVSAAIREELTEELLDDDYSFLNKPVTASPRTYANGKSVEADPTLVASSVAVYDIFMPLVLFCWWC
ncbi:MAG: hypothetical protein IKN55_12190 [Oscillospiraceae bacterium]|nr:hypothetical protein [Oscillospiraceae bacterium]